MENKICQSCGIPIDSEEQLGTNQDGSNRCRNIYKCALYMAHKQE